MWGCDGMCGCVVCCECGCGDNVSGGGDGMCGGGEGVSVGVVRV